MLAYVMDLSDYIGEELYIELHDEVIDGGWAHAFFDEVITYYKTAPNWQTKSDTVADGGTGNPVEIPWRLAVNLATANQTRYAAAPEGTAAVQKDEITAVSDDVIKSEDSPEAELEEDSSFEAEPEAEPEDTFEAEPETEAEDTFEAEFETEPEEKSADTPEAESETEPDHGEIPDNRDIEMPKKPEDLGASSEEDEQE